jgi:hypothetical protein
VHPPEDSEVQIHSSSDYDADLGIGDYYGTVT